MIQYSLNNVLSCINRIFCIIYLKSMHLYLAIWNCFSWSSQQMKYPCSTNCFHRNSFRTIQCSNAVHRRFVCHLIFQKHSIQLIGNNHSHPMLINFLFTYLVSFGSMGFNFWKNCSFYWLILLKLLYAMSQQ